LLRQAVTEAKKAKKQIALANRAALTASTLTKAGWVLKGASRKVGLSRNI
jgi:hypothetical protein